MTQEATQEKRQLREKIGVVVRAKMQKTIIVEVGRLVQHAVYHKVLRRRKRYMVHDEKGAAKVGDKVRIVETRPISKTKHWRFVETIKV